MNEMWLRPTGSLQPHIHRDRHLGIPRGLGRDVKWLNFSYILSVPRLLTRVSSIMPVEVCLLIEGFPRFQARGFSPKWVFWWIVRYDLTLNDFLHSLHSKGFSPVWIFSCVERFDFWLKRFPHTLHSYGFSPVWILWCTMSPDFMLKVFLHSLHS